MPPEPGPPRLDRTLLEQLIFGTGRVRRFTQDTPVLPDVWIEYGKGPADLSTRLTTPADTEDPHPPVKLLLTPFRDSAAGEVARALRQRLAAEPPLRVLRGLAHDVARRPRVVYNQSTVAATLYFEDLVRVVLPMTDWWQRLTRTWNPADLQLPDAQRALARVVRDPERPPSNERGQRLSPDVLWMIRVVGALAIVRQGGELPEVFTDPRRGAAEATDEDWLPLVRAVAELIAGLPLTVTGPRVYSVSLNREATPTVSRSTLAIKADAARRLFNVSCRDLTWAIVDSGVDARHPAFRLRDPTGKLRPAPFSGENGQTENRTRVVATYDFSQIDVLLDPDTPDLPPTLKARLAADTEASGQLKRTLEDLNNGLASGRSIDWSLVGPFLEVPHASNAYAAPSNDHGTHVAGILAGDWRRDESAGMLEDDLVGVCPDLRLYDLRVLNAEGRGDEFAVMAALQFVRHLNAANDYVVVHGVNLSLSIPHDISNYACGRTPVCDECERVVSAGVVVVAAAGNQGYRKSTSAEGVTTEAYNSISITDPGNADLVITVGATHRYRPHTYGVSYFSSRGPTGDGRIKPDLVAPGEKITAPLPDGSFGLKDGTSMAAPHVSGAAALLMARYNELVGRPGQIKQILCRTATDLGRERYFQGAGMLDVLRAIQSV
jgi:subtilisin family serine protease